MTRKRKVAAALTGFGLAAGLLAAAPLDANGASLNQGRIRVDASGKFLAKSGQYAVQSSTPILTTVNLATGSTTEHTVYGWDGSQGWCLTGSSSSAPANNTPATWQTCTWQPGPQRWLIAGTSGTKLINVPNGKALNLANGSTAEGAPLSLYTNGTWRTMLHTLQSGSGGGTTPTPIPTATPTPTNPPSSAEPCGPPSADTVTGPGGTFTSSFYESFNGGDVGEGAYVASPIGQRFGGADGHFDTNQGPGWYDRRKVVSVQNGKLQYRIRTEANSHNGAVRPLVANEAPNNWAAQQYGRYEFCGRADRMPGYKQAVLLWDAGPNGGDWTKGEVDYPENGFDGSRGFSGYNHCNADGDACENPQNNAYGFNVDGVHTEWTKFAIEWSPNLLVFYKNGVEVGRTTNDVPTTTMNYRLQVEAEGDGAPPSASVSGLWQADYVKMWRRS